MPVAVNHKLTERTSSEDTPHSCIAVLEEFGRFGFRRTSMVGLADGLGVSRQTLYNRFGSKEAVLAWAVAGLAEHVRDEALGCLARANGTASEVLQNVFWCWLGPIALMLHRHQHGEEILGLSRAELVRSQRDPLEGISKEVGAYLLNEKLRTDNKAAKDAAFLLAMAAKGLMHSCGSEKAFRAGIGRFVAGMGIR